jgi:hypothetical protein
VIPLLLSLEVVLGTAAVMLWARITRARGEVAAALVSPPPEGGDLAGAVSGHVRAHIDDTLLPVAGYGGLAALRVEPREHHDPYRSVADLLAWIGQSSSPGSLEHHAARIKAVHQLHHSLDLPDAALDSLLEPLLIDLRAVRFMDRPVARIDRIRPGDLVDRATTWPLNNGARIRHPLGVVVRDAEGRVISKAKAICA